MYLNHSVHIHYVYLSHSVHGVHVYLTYHWVYSIHCILYNLVGTQYIHFYNLQYITLKIKVMFMPELYLFYIELYHHHLCCPLRPNILFVISDQVLGTEICQSSAPHVFIVGHRNKLLLKICVVAGARSLLEVKGAFPPAADSP